MAIGSIFAGQMTYQYFKAGGSFALSVVGRFMFMTLAYPLILLGVYLIMKKKD